MKHLRKLSAALAAAALLLTLVPAASAWSVYGQEIKNKTASVAPGAAATAQAVWAPGDGLPRTEYYLTYSPNAVVRPVVRWGDYLLSRRTLDQMAQELEGQGLRVVGGINASFFESNGCPIGVVISGGRLLSANPEFQVIGFKADGSALLGQPTVALSASWTTPERTATLEDGSQMVVPAQAQNIALSGLNKIRNAGGYYLISGDYAPGTQNTLDGVDVVLRPDETQRGLPLNGDVACEVVGVRTSTADTSIPAGCFVLSMNSYSDAALLNVLRQLQPGDAVTLHVAISQGWEEVTEAVSGLHSLIAEGAPNPYLPWDGRAPRTAVGVRADGSVVFYAVDGRQNGHSLGATYTELAQRMIELGCVSAIALDGGGSTTFGATWPDSESFETINRPSDGKARAVSVCLFLVEDGNTATGELGGFLVDAGDGPVMAGTSIPVSALPLDTASRLLSWSGDMTWSAELGAVAPDGSGGWVYTAPAASGVVTDTITVTVGAVTGQAAVTVAASPTSLRLTDRGTGQAVSALELKAGDTASLSAAAFLYSWPLQSGPFTWSVSPEVGTVDQNGVFTAGTTAGTGTLTVQCGQASASIAVTVTEPEPEPEPEPGPEEKPFADIDGHWAEAYMTLLYQRGIAQGTVEGDGLRYFYPDSRLTRQEWAAFLVRLLGEDTAKYETVELPFADADAISPWALPYVRAAYALELMSGAQTGQGLMANPQAEITREEVMTVVGRALDTAQEADLSGYADADQVSGWALAHVQTLVARGIVQGSDGKLSPKSPITRGSAAKILCALLPS